MELRSFQVLTDRTARAEPCVATLPSPPISRVANIDRLRILAALGVIWFHTEAAPHREIGYAGLPIFLLIFFSLITARSHLDGITRFVRRRCDRLIVPWLFWSVVYGVCKFGKAMLMMDMESLHEVLSMKSLLAGTHIHLWYLPFAFVSGLLIYIVNGWTLRVSNAAAILAATILGVLTLWGNAMFVFGRTLPIPLPQWCYGLAAILLGFAIGRCMLFRSPNTRASMLLVIAVTVSATCVVLSFMGFLSLGVPYGLGTALVCVAWALPLGSDAVVRRLAPLAFGVYLIHPLVCYGLTRFAVPSEHYAALFVLTACISGLATFALTKTPLRRFV